VEKNLYIFIKGVKEILLEGQGVVDSATNQLFTSENIIIL